MRIFKAHVRHLALVDLPCSRHAWNVVKGDGGALSLSFTTYVPFEKASADGLVAGLAYSRPDEVDAAGDFMKREDLEWAAKTFFASGSVLNWMHKRNLHRDEAEVTKSEILQDGSWFVEAQIHDPKIAADCRAGVLKGFSIGGTCTPKRAQTAEEERAELLAAQAELEQMARELGIDVDELRRKREAEEAAHRAYQVVWDARPESKDWRFPPR